MRRALLVFACLAFAGHGRREEISKQQLISRSAKSPLRSLAVLLLTSRPTAAFSPSHQAGPRVPATLRSVASGRPVRRISDVRAAAPGTLGKTDQEEFKKNPSTFCSERMEKHGNTFKTGAFGGATFLGDSAAIASAIGDPAPGKEPLAPPFAQLPENFDPTEMFKKHELEFSWACYQNLFTLIPLNEEKGAVWVLDLDPLYDDDTKIFRATLRNIVFNGIVPWLFNGTAKDNLPGLLDIQENTFYKGYRARTRRYLSGGKDAGRETPPGILGWMSTLRLRKARGGSDKDIAALEAAMDKYAKETGAFPDGETALYYITSTVEQIAGLVCNMWVSSWEYTELSDELKKENQAVLKGRKPKANITIEDLDKMTLLDAFTKEVLRLYPPARPARRKISAPLEGDGYSLEAGTLVALEPLVAHLDPAKFENATNFDPSRWQAEDGSIKDIAPLMPFASAPDKVPFTSPGEQMSITVAKMVFAWILRMFTRVTFPIPEGDRQSVFPAGYPLYSTPEGQKFRMYARVYYKLNRPSTEEFVGI
mmetsp:Transcript_121165/g.214311  ORF Transcript_121165/g.214311 Transcript_121165/m.214311 type:complete len:537 (+) Transcript_121165:69-1679(+)